MDFTPIFRQVQGQHLFYTAADVASITLGVGNDVSEWVDQNGGPSLLSSGAPPQYDSGTPDLNGLAAVEFLGDTMNATFDTPLVNPDDLPVSVLMLCRIPNLVFAHFLAEYTNTIPNTRRNTLQKLASSDGTFPNQVQANSTIGNQHPDPVDDNTAWYAIGNTYTSTGVTIWVDGVSFSGTQVSDVEPLQSVDINGARAEIVEFHHWNGVQPDLAAETTAMKARWGL